MLLGYLNVHLESLSLIECQGMNRDLFSAIIDLVPNLNSLKLDCLDSQFITDALKKIGDKLVNLQALDLRHMPNSLLKDGNLKSLEKLTKINCLQISAYYVSTDAYMSLFGVYSNLKVVEIIGSKCLNSE